jgi:hypothetical protein
MPLSIPLDPERLRCIRSSANLVGFGQVVYCVEGARWQASESRLRPPRYHWLFVPLEVPTSVSSSTLHLTEPLQSALLSVARQGGSLHVEGWGLLRKVEQGVELMAEPGPLSDDHPHYGWQPLHWNNRWASKVRSSMTARSKSRRSVWLYALVWLVLVGLGRFALVVDGTEATQEQRLAWAGYPHVWSLKVPFTRSTDPFDPCVRQASLISPIEKPGEGPYPASWPVHRVVVGLYSQKPLADAKLIEISGLGYSVCLTPRWARGRWLTAVCLEYRGLYVQDFLQDVRSKVVPEAWIWPEAV